MPIEPDKAIPTANRLPVAAESSEEAGRTAINRDGDTTAEFLSRKSQESVVTYSAESEVRRPVQLIKNIFADFMAGRELAWRLFVRNLRGLYRQTLLGLFWAFLPPIANTAMWIFLKSAGVFETGDTQVNATVYILTGMILWQAFIEAFQMPLTWSIKIGNMLSKLNFPRESLLLVGIAEVLFDLAIRLTLLIPAFLIFGVPIHGFAVAGAAGNPGIGPVRHLLGPVDHACRLAVPGCRSPDFDGDSILDDPDTDYLCPAKNFSGHAVELGEPGQPVVAGGPRLDPAGYDRSLDDRIDICLRCGSHFVSGPGRLPGLDPVF